MRLVCHASAPVHAPRLRPSPQPTPPAPRLAAGHRQAGQAFAAAAAALMLSCGQAHADAVSELLAGGGAASEPSPLVARLLARSAENKAVNDAERKDYSKQYSSYFGVLKATSSYVPSSDAERAQLGYSRPAECNIPFFQASDLCLAFEGREAAPALAAAATP